MGGVQDAVHHRIAKIDVGMGHVDLAAQRAGAVRKLAGLHAGEQVEVLGHAAVAERAVLARPVGRAPVFLGVLGAQVADVGLALFNDPNKGNCASCHTSAKGSDGAHPLFTDYTYDNLGLPRNMEIPANLDANYFDLGLCGRADLNARFDLCGAFKVPSLRNVALRKTYFHNSAFKSLKDAVTFYVQRDTNPEKWYPLNSDGTVNKFNDLLIAQRGNVNTTEAPYNRLIGDVPALSDAEVDDVIVFLRTLTDGWSRANGLQ